jgi:hypothetical protein
MWRRVQGCSDPTSAPRQPGGDLACDVAPGVYASGFCDCTDGVPRPQSCGEAKRACKERCAAPPSPSSLPAAFAPAKTEVDEGSGGGGGGRTPPWWRTHAPSLVVLGVVLVLAVAQRVSSPSKVGKRRLLDMLAAQRREIAFERQFA